MSEKNPNQSQVLLYQTEDQQMRLEVCLDGETVWLALNQMAELFQRDKSVISRHLGDAAAARIYYQGVCTGPHLDIPKQKSLPNAPMLQNPFDVAQSLP